MDNIPRLVPDRQALLTLAEMPEGCHAEIEFFVTMGRAIIVLDNLNLEMSEEKQEQINRQSNWDVFVLSHDRYEQIKSAAMEAFNLIPNVSKTTAQLLIDNGWLGIRRSTWLLRTLLLSMSTLFYSMKDATTFIEIHSVTTTEQVK